MKQKTEKQKALDREVSRIKKTLPKTCCVCGSRDTIQAAHLLPRSTYPEYYTEPWNIVPMCRNCHYKFDNQRRFRYNRHELYYKVAEHDECAAHRHFDL